jgi:glucose/arabinose dehydrogenase
MKILNILGTLTLLTSMACQSTMASPLVTQATPLRTKPPTINPTDLPPSTIVSPTLAAPAVTWPAISLVQIITGLSQPVQITHAGDGSGRLFIIEKSGRIKIFNNYVYQGVFLDISAKVSTSSEQGLLSVAFPPGYDTSGRFYVNYTNLAGDTVIARYQVSADVNRADAASEEILLTIDQPYANHNGGQMAFGPDGYLYIGMGDGGSGGDPENRAQNPADLLGKLLRIDVEPAGTTTPPPTGSILVFMPVLYKAGPSEPYRIPPNNPFIHTPGYRSEIWAIGLRNPWRFSFDRSTGDLYIADVGQNDWEEVNFQSNTSPGGENYGWRILEGNHCYNPSSGCVPPSSYVAPVLEYAHGANDVNGCSISGGYVYRGNDHPSMQGIYFYGDFCSGKIWGATLVSSWSSNQLTTAPFMISTFGEDEAGELYVAGYNNGTIYKIQGN